MINLIGRLKANKLPGTHEISINAIAVRKENYSKINI